MKFSWFAGRKREEERILQVMRGNGVFAELPPDTEDFIMDKYSTQVPYHNRIHALYGLAFMHRWCFPLMHRLAYVGHDAGHNGNGDESPELTSAYLTYVWLNRHGDWLANREIDPQDVAQTILHTRFPYSEGTIDFLDAQFIRTVDVFRIYSGMTYDCLGARGSNNIMVAMFEYLPLFNEMEPGKASSDDREEHFMEWHAKIPEWYTRLQRMDCWSSPDRQLSDSMPMFFEQTGKAICCFQSDPEIARRLAQVYTFLNGDVTYPEFMEYVRKIILPFKPAGMAW